jgi:hypothetical protein
MGKWEVHADIQPNMPNSHWKEVDLCLFVDSDNSGELCPRESRARFLIYLNMAPSVRFPTHHPPVESSVFGYDYVAMNKQVETLSGLQTPIQVYIDWITSVWFLTCLLGDQICYT